MVEILTHSQQQIFQASRCFPLDALLHLVSRNLHVGVKHWNTQVGNESGCDVKQQQAFSFSLRCWDTRTNLSSDALHCGFPEWWRMFAHQCRTSPLLPWRGPTSTETSGAMMDLWWQRNFRIWHHSPYIPSLDYLDSICAEEEWAEQIRPFQSLTRLCSHITDQGDSNTVDPNWTSSNKIMSRKMF